MSPPRVCNIRASLGLGSSSSDAKWNRIQADAREILGCKGLLGKSATSTEVREKKLDATKELEKLYPSVFRRISSPSHRENIVYDIFTLEMDKFRGKERLKSRDPNNVPNSSEKIVVTISTPPVLSRFSSQLLRTDLVGVDGSISIDKLHEVLQEDGLGYSELKYSIQDEYGYPLSCSRHLQASFQRVANEGKLLTNWLISWDALGTSAPQPNPLFLVKSETLVSPKPPPRLGSPIVFRNDTSKKSATPEKVNPVVKVEKTTSSLNSYIIVDSDSDDYYLPASDSNTPLIKSYRTRNLSPKTPSGIYPMKRVIGSSSGPGYRAKDQRYTLNIRALNRYLSAYSLQRHPK